MRRNWQIPNTGRDNQAYTVPMSQLAKPDEGLRVLHLLCYHLLNNIPSVDINSANGHDPLSVSLREITEQKVDESVQLVDLFLVVVFECCLKAFLHPAEGYVHFRGPPDLSTS